MGAQYNALVNGDPVTFKYENTMEEELYNACRHGNLVTVKKLLESGCDPKINHNWAMLWASINRHLDIVKYLLEYGCDYNIKKEYKYEALREVKLRLLIFMHTIPKNTYLKKDILKRVIPYFTDHEIMSVL